MDWIRRYSKHLVTLYAIISTALSVPQNLEWVREHWPRWLPMLTRPEAISALVVLTNGALLYFIFWPPWERHDRVRRKIYRMMQRGGQLWLESVHSDRGLDRWKEKAGRWRIEVVNYVAKQDTATAMEIYHDLPVDLEGFPFTYNEDHRRLVAQISRCTDLLDTLLRDPHWPRKPMIPWGKKPV